MPEEKLPREIPLFTQRNPQGPAVRTAKPRVFIPVFPGTNCEVDTARAFEAAGAQTDILVVRNLSPAEIEDTLREMEKRIRQAQILMFPGGFSAATNRTAPASLIATTFRNPRMAEAVSALLEQRDGLIWGFATGSRR